VAAAYAAGRDQVMNRCGHDSTTSSHVPACIASAAWRSCAPGPRPTPTFTSALTAAEALLALTDSNATALQARALALVGLATAAGDPARTSEAAQAFTHARTITSAAGVAAETQILLEMIAAHD
jgi:hypothetical protein